MDRNMQWLKELKINKTMEALKKNNITPYYVKNSNEVINIIESIAKVGDKVAVGGSMTLDELKILDYLRMGKYEFLDRYKEGLTRDEVVEIFRQSLLSDVFFTSTNAVTEEGFLYNVDGNGNRAAAMLFGPKKVIVICGTNKIVKDVNEAIERNKTIAAPVNAKRLDRKTPCTKVGHCMDCKSEERICKKYTLIKNESIKDRMYLIFVDDILGY